MSKLPQADVLHAYAVGAVAVAVADADADEDEGDVRLSNIHSNAALCISMRIQNISLCI